MCPLRELSICVFLLQDTRPGPHVDHVTQVDIGDHLVVACPVRVQGGLFFLLAAGERVETGGLEGCRWVRLFRRPVARGVGEEGVASLR